jgi:hypothetical protein
VSLAVTGELLKPSEPAIPQKERVGSKGWHQIGSVELTRPFSLSSHPVGKPPCCIKEPEFPADSVNDQYAPTRKTPEPSDSQELFVGGILVAKDQLGNGIDYPANRLPSFGAIGNRDQDTGAVLLGEPGINGRGAVIFNFIRPTPGGGQEQPNEKETAPDA